jgi:molybdopterin synthase sulfur carrier subunit
MAFVPTSPVLYQVRLLWEVTMQDSRTEYATVRIPVALRQRTRNQREVQVTGRTVREIIDALERDYPGLRFNLCHETGELRPYVNVFLGPENVRCLDGLDTRVPHGSMVHIIHSVAGG